MVRAAATYLALVLVTGACHAVVPVDDLQEGSCVRPPEGPVGYVGEGEARLTIGKGEGGAGGAAGMGGVSSGGDGGSFTQSIGPQLPASVRHLDGCCWELAIELADDGRGAHLRETTTYCGVERGAVLTKAGAKQSQNWNLGFGGDTITTITCDTADIFRPGMAPNAPWTHQCSGESNAQVGFLFSNARFTYQDPAACAAGGPPNSHCFYEVTFYSGTLFGRLTATHWFDITTGLPLETHRSIELSADSPLGDVLYQETSHWRLGP